jgi:heme/copper-type cytochrome/quinol oxidase subunit 2
VGLFLVFHLVFAVVFGVMLWTTLFHPATSRKQTDAPAGEGSQWAEIVWAVLPIVIFYALVWPTMQLVGAH